MKLIFTILIFSSFSLFSQGWIQTDKFDSVRYGEISTFDESTYLFTYHTREIGILRSTDNALTWDTLVYGNPEGFENEYPSEIDFIDENTALFALGRNGNLFLYKIDTKEIEHIKLDATQSIVSISMLDKNNGICASSSELFITKDGWKNYKKFEANELVKCDLRIENNLLVYYYLTLEEGLESNSKFYRTLDSGNTWTESFLGDTLGLDINLKNDNSILLTASRYINVDNELKAFDLILKSTDFGKTWVQKLSSKSNKRVGLYNIKFYNNDIGIASGLTPNTYLTYDGGETWIKQEISSLEDLNQQQPTFGGFTQTKFILGVWNNGLYQKSIATTSVNDEELTKKYKYTLIDNIILLENNEKIDFKIYKLTGQLIEEGKTSDIINLNLLEKGVYLITLNNEFSIKFIR